MRSATWRWACFSIVALGVAGWLAMADASFAQGGGNKGKGKGKGSSDNVDNSKGGKGKKSQAPMVSGGYLGGGYLGIDGCVPPFPQKPITVNPLNPPFIVITPNPYPWNPWNPNPWYPNPWNLNPWNPWNPNPWNPWTVNPWNPWTVNPWNPFQPRPCWNPWQIGNPAEFQNPFHVPWRPRNDLIPLWETSTPVTDSPRCRWAGSGAAAGGCADPLTSLRHQPAATERRAQSLPSQLPSLATPFPRNIQPQRGDALRAPSAQPLPSAAAAVPSRYNGSLSCRGRASANVNSP